MIAAFALALMANAQDGGPVGDAKAAPGGTPTLAGLSAELTQATAPLPALNATMSETTEANVGLQKEAKVYTDDQNQKLAALAAAQKYQLDNVYGPIKRPYDAALASYAGRCVGRPL
ncbi:MAG TPA: hypothetical protein VE176_04810, partial [Candidatus Limnocylindrales bacterium]|nr:hypothetical protein [Candidatus Limnocylindrales bacterium]